MKVLVDNSVRHHAVAIRGEWQESVPSSIDEKICWEVLPGEIISREKVEKIKEEKGGPQGRWIASLAISNKNGAWEAHSTDALCFETWHHKSSLYAGEKHGDKSLLSHVHFTKHKTLHGFSFSFPCEENIVSILRAYLDISTDPQYLHLKSVLGTSLSRRRSSQDIWHMACLERLGLERFLTCDTKLISAIKSVPDKALRQEWLHKVVLPITLCKELSLPPLSDDDFNNLILNL